MFYKIAECVTECTPMYAMAKERMKPYEAEDGKEDFKIGFSEEFLRQRQSENPHLTQEQCEYIYLTDRFYKKLLLHGGMMLHASAVTVDDRAYLFSAKSGTGKSTHTKQWQKLFGSHRAEILNDDKPALRRTEDGWFTGHHSVEKRMRTRIRRSDYRESACWKEVWRTTLSGWMQHVRSLF